MRRLLFIAIFLTLLSQAYAQSSTDDLFVDSVAVVGNKRIDNTALVQQLKIRSGAITREQITQEIKALYATGFFDQVTAKLAYNGAGRKVLTYELVEKPLVRKVFVTGNKEVKEEEFAQVIKFEGHKFLDKAKIDLLKRRIIAFYQLQGMYDASVEHSVVPAGDNQVDVTFNVVEGRRYRVRGVSLKGLEILEESEVKSELQTKRYKWWSSWLFGTGRVNEEMLEADKQVLRQYLLDNGFVEGTVGDAVVEKREDGLYVVFDLNEGPQYKIGRIDIAGDLIEGDKKLTLEGIETEPGEIFSASKVRADIFKITDKFSDQGFAFANVVPNTDLKRDQELVDLSFAVNKGRIVKINKINIVGNDKTYDHVIRRNLRISEQSTYSGTKIKRSQTLLERLGYFEEASISNEPTNNPDEVDLNVNVREGATGSFSAGAGYASGNGLLFNTRIAENNLFGTGRRLNLNLDFGTIRNNQVLSFDDPMFLDSNLSLGIDAMRTSRQLIDFTRDQSGGSITLGYPGEFMLGEWAQDTNFSLRYDYSSIDITRVADDAADLIKRSTGKSTASAIIPTITRNTINNPLNPTKGSRQVLSFEYAGPGGDQRYYVAEVRNSWYYPLLQTSFGTFTLSDRTQFGYGKSSNDDPFPVFRRFFPGGINSMRGFRAFSLGPKDSNGSVFGGSKQLVNNFEIIFPLLQSAGMQGVIFYDVGQAYDDNDPIKLADLRQAYGYGIRWNSPLGPIRVEFGLPLSREPGESKIVPMFSFGAPL